MTRFRHPGHRSVAFAPILAIVVFALGLGLFYQPTQAGESRSDVPNLSSSVVGGNSSPAGDVATLATNQPPAAVPGVSGPGSTFAGPDVTSPGATPTDMPTQTSASRLTPIQTTPPTLWPTSEPSAPTPTPRSAATTPPTVAPEPTAGTPLVIANYPIVSSQPNHLVTNEFAHWSPGNPARVVSSIWEMTSGSLFEEGGAGWSGVPDDIDPNATSSTGNDSAVFRLNTTRYEFGDVAVSFDLDNQGLVTTARTPAQAYDGVDIWFRYQSEYTLYAVHVNRRDGTVAIEKKVAGGPNPVNGGTYYPLAKGVHAVPYGATWQKIKGSIRTNPNGSVTIDLYEDGLLVLSATDDGSKGGPPITSPGAVGIRGDNCNFLFKNFTVSGV